MMIPRTIKIYFISEASLNLSRKHYQIFLTKNILTFILNMFRDFDINFPFTFISKVINVHFVFGFAYITIVILVSNKSVATL